MSCVRLVQGNQACALGALAAGARFFGGYPITPSSEIAEIMAREMPEVGGTFVQMEDEIGSLAAVIGASLGGARAFTATSGPGFSLMQENIGFATIAEVPCVVVNVMRAGPSTGRPTSPSQGDVMQARWGTHGDHQAVVLAPASVREVFDLTVRAFDLADRLRQPVILTYDEVLGHLREGIELPDGVRIEGRATPDVPPEEFLPKAAPPNGVPPLPAFGEGYRFHVTGLTHDQRGFPTDDAAQAGALLARLDGKISSRRDEIVVVEEEQLDDAEVVVFAYGVVARAAREAIAKARAAGVAAGLFRPATLWPFPDAEIAAAARRAGTVIVAEMNQGQMLGEVERAVAGTAKIVPVLRYDGEPLTPDAILDALLDRIAVPKGALS